MKILIIDVGSNALDLAMRWQQAGHEVKWYDKPRPDGTDRRAGEGIIEKIRDFNDLRKKWIGWADLIYTPDNVCYLDLLEPYRKIGYPIFGCNLEAVEWELDREVGQKVMEECGMPIIPGKTFHDYDSAIAYVKKQGKPFVSKPSGDGERAMSYVANNAADLVYMLQRWKEIPKYVKAAKEDGFILQEKIEGMELAVGGWFGPAGWSRYWVENFEAKKLFNGDLGVNTGEQGTVVMIVKHSKLADQVLKPATEHLKRVGYVGYVDVNCMITPDGTPYPLEWTMRDGWPIRHNLTSLIEGDQAQWMLDKLNGKDTMKCKVDTVSISVVMALPDYPYSKITNKELCNIPIYGAESQLENVHLSEVMLGVAPREVNGKVVDLPGFVTAGDYVLVATGVSPTITGARRSVYSTLKKIKVPNSPFYRTDIGAGRVKKQLPILQALGYAKGFEY